MLPSVAAFLRSNLGLDDDPASYGAPEPPAQPQSADWDAAQRPSTPSDWSQPVQPVTSSYNDPDAGGTISQPLPQYPTSIPPVSREYPESVPGYPEPPSYTLADGRTAPATPQGSWEPATNLTQPVRPAVADPGQWLAEDSVSTPLSAQPQMVTQPEPFSPYGAPRSAAADINPAAAPDYGDGGRARQQAQQPTISAASPVQAYAGEPDYVPQRTNVIDTVTAPARNVFGAAIDEANTKHDALDEARRKRQAGYPEPESDPMRQAARALETATNALGATNRVIDIVNSVLLSTPLATADTINLALRQIGADRDGVLGVPIPGLGIRVGIADIIDLPGGFSGLTNMGAARASSGVMRAGSGLLSRVGEGVGQAIEQQGIAMAPALEMAGGAIAQGVRNVAAPVVRAGRGLVDDAVQAGSRALRAGGDAPVPTSLGSGFVPSGDPTRPVSGAVRRTPPPEGYAAPGDLTQASRADLPNREVFEASGWRVNETEGNLGYMPPGGTKPAAIEARMRVWEQIEPNPRIPPGLKNDDMERFLDDLARLRNGLLTGETSPESQVLGSLLAIASVNRGGTSFAKTLRTLSATTGRNAEELAARVRPDVYYQRGGTGQQQGINIRPEIIWSMIAGDTTDPTMMRMLTAIARPDSYANPVLRQRAVTQGVEELYRRLRGGASPIGGVKVAETIHGDFANPQAILGYPTQRTSKKTGEVTTLQGGSPWHLTEPERIREMGNIARAMAGQAPPGSPYAGLAGEELRIAAIERLLERSPSGIGPTKSRFTASMTALPEYATLDTRMLRDVFGISPAASTLLSVPEYELLSSKLRNLGSKTKYLYGQQWLPWEFLTGEKTTYNSLSGIYDNLNRFMSEAEATARSTGRPIGDVVGELAERESRLNIELADPVQVQARVGLAFRELTSGAADAQGSEALIQGLQPGEATKGALEKAFPELFKIADDAGLVIEGKPGVGIGGWKSDKNGKYYLDRTFDLAVSGPKPAVRWFASAMMMGLPKEEAVLLTYRGAGAKLDDHIGSIAVEGMTRQQVEEWSTALSDAFPGWSISAKPRAGGGQRLYDINIMSGAKTEYGGNGHDLESQMSALAERMQRDGHVVKFNGIEPAEMEFIERVQIEEVVRGGPRGATVVPARGVAADSAAQGDTGAGGGLRAADGSQANRGEQAASLGSDPLRSGPATPDRGDKAGVAAGSSFVPTMSDAGNAAQGAVIGAASEGFTDEELTPQERLGRMAGGATLAVAAGRSARGGTRVPGQRRAGSGFLSWGGDDPAAAMRGRIVPPHVADTLDFPVRVPTDPSHIRAIEAAGGSVDPERGVTMNVIRNQGPEAHGGKAARASVFYIAGEPGAPNPFASSVNDPNRIGGTERIEGMTRFRSPIFISDAPGSERGFREAMEQFGVRGHPDLERAQSAANAAEIWRRRTIEDRDAAFDRWKQANPGASVDQWASSEDGQYFIQAVSRAVDEADEARMQVRALTKQQPPPTAKAVDDAIYSARRAGPAGSPARAAALKEVVRRFGGTPEEIDDLLRIRGDEQDESRWAIRENILAAHARRNGYDGVVTVQKDDIPPWNYVSKHPDVIATKQARDEAISAALRAQKRVDADLVWHQKNDPDGDIMSDPLVKANADELQRLTSVRDTAVAAYEAAVKKAQSEWKPLARITELADVREARNPTPGAEGPELAAAGEKMYAAERRAFSLTLREQGAYEALRDNTDPSRVKELTDAYMASTQAMKAARAEWQAADAAYRALEDAPNAYGPPGYTLRDDVPRRPIVADPNTGPPSDPRFSTPKASGIMPFDPVSAAAGGAAGAELDEDGNPVGVDPLRAAGGAAVAGILGKGFPKASAWYKRQAAINARRVAMSGKPPLSPLEWTRSMAGNVGYSSMLGPGTLSVNLATGIGEPVWSIPKEGVRGAVRAVQTRNLSALREQGEMTKGALYGLAELGTDILGALKERRMPRGNPVVDVVAGRGKYAPNPNFPTLSQQTVNPIAQIIAQAVEAPGRVWSGLPDAIFGTMSQRAGEYREAAQIATNKGLKGAEWKAETNRLLTDARAVARGELPTDATVQQVVDAGAKYADRQTYRDELGTIGKQAEGYAKLGNRPVVGTWAAPFFKTIWTGGVRQAEKTPFGLGMNSQATVLDRRYDALVGGAVVLGMAEYARRGNVTGSGPSDPKERELLREKGWQPYSTYVQLPGMEGRYVPNRMFGIFEGTLNAAGETHDAFAYQKPDADGRAKFDGAMRRTGQLIRQNPYAFQGIVSILDMYNEGPIAWAAGEAARMTPFGASARTIGMAGDTHERTTDRGKGVEPLDEFAQRWKLSTGQRKDLPVAQDAFGQPRENQRPGIAALLPNIPREKAAPIADLFREARMPPGAPRPEIRISKSESVPPMPLKPAERRMWDQKRGEVLLEAGAELLADPEWKAAPLERKQQILRGIMDTAAGAADNHLKESIGDDEITRRIDAAVERKQRQAS